MKERFKASAERGQSMIDYALILSLVAVVAVISLSVAGTSIRHAFSNVVNGLESNTPQYGTDDGGGGGQENEDPGNEDPGNEDPGDDDPGDVEPEDEHEGEQCQVTQRGRRRTTYFLFTMQSGEWQYQDQSQHSFHVAECPDGTMQ